MAPWCVEHVGVGPEPTRVVGAGCDDGLGRVPAGGRSKEDWCFLAATGGSRGRSTVRRTSGLAGQCGAASCRRRLECDGPGLPVHGRLALAESRSRRGRHASRTDCRARERGIAVGGIVGAGLAPCRSSRGLAGCVVPGGARLSRIEAETVPSPKACRLLAVFGGWTWCGLRALVGCVLAQSGDRHVPRTTSRGITLAADRASPGEPPSSAGVHRHLGGDRCELDRAHSACELLARTVRCSPSERRCSMV